MKIAILGTRGIPNNYGGCEANAAMISPRFIAAGHEVTVYCSSEHVYQDSEWQGVKLKHVYCPESRVGIWGTLLYDFLCLRDACNSDFDIILELGYVPVALFYPIFRRRPCLLTNMDGLEWRRTKWNALLQRFTHFTEYLGARFSDGLIADNEAIQEHLLEAYGKQSYLIAYGAEQVEAPVNEHLLEYDVEAGAYYMLVARLEPENNIEMILQGYRDSGSSDPMLVVGNTATKYGQKLVEQFSDTSSIRFLGGVFDYNVLSSLRWLSRCYFHGHSVGGTNPSLLEAMASNALIAIHDNPFNAAVVGEHALRFGSAAEVKEIIESDLDQMREAMVAANREKIETRYTWDRAAQEHLTAFADILGQ